MTQPVAFELHARCHVASELTSVYDFARRPCLSASNMWCGHCVASCCACLHRACGTSTRAGRTALHRMHLNLLHGASSDKRQVQRCLRHGQARSDNLPVCDSTRLTFAPHAHSQGLMRCSSQSLDNKFARSTWCRHAFGATSRTRAPRYIPRSKQQPQH